MLILAHRGASAFAPENTRPAFCKAIHCGADGVELDVHLTKDNQMVVHHDFEVDDTSNGTGLIRELTLAQLKKLDFGSWKGKKFSGTKILTLEEALSLVKEMQLINIELKTLGGFYPELPRLACSLIQKMGLTNRVIFSSFHHASVVECKRYLPHVRIGLLYRRPMLRPVAYALRLGADALHPYALFVSRGLIRRCHRHKIAVITWTVDRPTAQRRFCRWGCDALITNQPNTKG